MPGQIPPGSRGSGRRTGHGPFGDKAFRWTLAVCAVVVVLAPVLLILGGPGVRAVGTAFLVLGALGLLTGGLGLVAERRILARAPARPPTPGPAPPSADLPRRNGRAPHAPDISRVRKPPRRST